MAGDQKERRDRAQRAAAARWQASANIPKAIHEGEIEIGNALISCAILEKGVRVISQRSMSAALGRHKTGSGTSGNKSGQKQAEIDGVAELPNFLRAKNLKPFISPELAASLTEPIQYVPLHGGRTAYGFNAELFPEICDVWIQAKDSGVLTTVQRQTAQIAYILVRGLAQTGIIALVDEATGYQYDRPRRDLEEHLKKFLSESLRKWVRTFPADYFKHLCRLRGVELRTDMRLPQHFGHLTNNLVYRRIAPGLLKKLKERRSEMGSPSNKLHSWASLEHGIPEVLLHLGTVVGLMKLHTDYEDFEKQLDQIAPVFPDTPGLFDNPKDWE